jgi:hypothetical protein
MYRRKYSLGISVCIYQFSGSVWFDKPETEKIKPNPKPKKKAKPEKTEPNRKNRVKPEPVSLNRILFYKN